MTAPTSNAAVPGTTPSNLPLVVPAVALAAVTVWAGTPVVTKLAVADLSPLAVGALRTLLAGLCTLPILLVARIAFPRSWATRGSLSVSALAGFVLFPLLFSLGVARTSAGHAALLIAVSPIFTGLIDAALSGRWPGRRWWLGSAVATLGVVLLVDTRFGLAAPGADLVGNLLVLLSCIMASAGYVTGARASRDIGTWPVTLWGLTLASLALLPALPWLLPLDRLAAAGSDLWAALLYLALLSSIIAYAGWYWALGKGDIGRLGLLQFAQPVIGVMLALLVLHEPLTWPLVLAAVLVLVGLLIARKPPPPKRSV